MTLEEIIAILKQFDPNVDIQGTSRDGPFTLTWFGVTFTIDTLEELQAQVGELGTPPEVVQPTQTNLELPAGVQTTSGTPAPFAPPKAVGTPPDWWDEKQDGKFPSDWDYALYGEYPFKTTTRKNEAGETITEIAGPDRSAADSRRRSIGTDIERTTPVQEEPPREAEVVDLDGERFIRQPSGSVTRFPEQEPASRSLDQMLIDAVESGDLMEQERVINLMDRVESIRNRPRPMNDQEIFEFLAPIAQNPQHFEELLRAFKQDMGQQAPLVSVGSQGKRFPTLSFGETIPSLTEVDERMRALTGQTGPVSEPVAQAIEAGYRPLQSQPPQGQIAAENGRFYDPATGVWEPWEQFQARMAENEQSRQVAVQSQQQAQVQVPTGAPSTTQATQTTQPRVPQLNAGGNVVKQGAAFGGTAQAGGGFFPIPQGSVLQERFTREFNEAQQQRFKRRGVPQVRFK